MNNDPKILRAKQLLKSLAQKIPQTLQDVEKQVFIGSHIINDLSIEEKTLLRNFLNIILIQMRNGNASDIDLGGEGSKNKIWLRIHGKKTPIEKFGSYTNDEFNILIQNGLMDKQRQILFEDRSIDFSHSIKNGEGNVRYRATAYFELGELALNMRAIGAQIRPYEGFGFHQNVTKMLSLVYSKEGLNLVTGITGSGKSSTLDTIVDLNNRSNPQ